MDGGKFNCCCVLPKSGALPALRSGCTQEFLAGKQRSRFYHTAMMEKGPNKKVRHEDRGLLKNAADATFTVISATRSGTPDWRVKAPRTMTLKAAAKMVSGAYSYGIFAWLGRSFGSALDEHQRDQNSQTTFCAYSDDGCSAVLMPFAMLADSEHASWCEDDTWFPVR